MASSFEGYEGSEYPNIVHDEDVRAGRAIIRGTTLMVMDIYERVIECDERPTEVAGDYNVDLHLVYEALSYYYANKDEMQEQREFEGRE